MPISIYYASLTAGSSDIEALHFQNNLFSYRHVMLEFIYLIIVSYCAYFLTRNWPALTVTYPKIFSCSPLSTR